MTHIREQKEMLKWRKADVLATELIIEKVHAND